MKKSWLRLAILVPYWGVVVWVTVALFGSMLFDLYGAPPSTPPQPGAPLPQATRAWCLRQATDLHGELNAYLQFAISQTAHVPAQESAQEQAAAAARYAEWQASFNAAAARCKDESDPQLADLFAQLHTIAQNYTEVMAQLSHLRQDNMAQFEGGLRRLIKG